MFETDNSGQPATTSGDTARGNFEQVAVIDRRYTGHDVDSEHKSLAQRITAQLEATMATPGLAGKIWIRSLFLVIAAAAVAYAYQLAYGLQVTAMREYISWGVYITNFVFFIG